MANPLRKTMVYLGLADEDSSTSSRACRTRRAGRARAPAAAGRAPVTPLRRPSASRHAGQPR